MTLLESTRCRQENVGHLPLSLSTRTFSVVHVAHMFATVDIGYDDVGCNKVVKTWNMHVLSVSSDLRMSVTSISGKAFGGSKVPWFGICTMRDSLEEN